jgi:hypothetical protein
LASLKASDRNTSSVSAAGRAGNPDEVADLAALLIGTERDFIEAIARQEIRRVVEKISQKRCGFGGHAFSSKRAGR